MTRKEVIVRAIEQITVDDLRDHGPAHAPAQAAVRAVGLRWPGRSARSGWPRRQRIALETIERICALKRQRYADFSVQHFWEKVCEEHQIDVGYTWLKLTSEAAGLAEKSPGAAIGVGAKWCAGG